jgi:hypothetical protein
MASAFDKMMGRVDKAPQEVHQEEPAAMSAAEKMQAGIMQKILGPMFSPDMLGKMAGDVQQTIQYFKDGIDRTEKNTCIAINGNRAIMRHLGFTDEQIIAAERGDLEPGDDGPGPGTGDRDNYSLRD